MKDISEQLKEMSPYYVNYNITINKKEMEMILSTLEHAQDDLDMGENLEYGEDLRVLIEKLNRAKPL